MAEIGLRERMLVKDIMSSPVISIYENDNAYEAARLMDKHNVGCVVVIDKQGKPLGVITERDLVVRVLARNNQPSKLIAKEVMSSPLITVDPDEKLGETARRMSKIKIRRLGVMYKGNLVGLISTSTSILSLSFVKNTVLYEVVLVSPFNLCK